MTSSRSLVRAAFIGVVAVGLLVAVVEIGLRAAGLPKERRGSRVIYQQVFTPTLASERLPNGELALATQDARVPFQWVTPQKSPGHLRVFVYGGSAAGGLGYSPNGTFARELERMLVAAYPERAIEVVNFGIVALASAQVLELLRDGVERAAPDWVLVYAGNNEFLELHSARFADATRSTGESVIHALRESRIARLLAHPRPVDPRAVEESISARALARSSRRVAHRELMAQVELTPAEEEPLFAAYERNLAAMAAAARERGSRAILAAPAVNWRWRGLEDRPADWIETLLREAGEGADAASPAGLTRALGLLDRAVAEAPSKSRWERLHERAEVHERLGDMTRARDDYRASMNADPHRRRATDRMVGSAARAAAAEGAIHFDAVAQLEAEAPFGIVGFEHFYDYVHPTPRGCVALAAGFFALIREVEGPPSASFDLDEHVRMRLAHFDEPGDDPLDVAHFLGIGTDRARISSRDLWKADRCWDELDERIAADPRDARALAWRGNFQFFRRRGFDAARADYEQSLAVEPDPVVAQNLARLLDDRRPGH